MSYDVYLEGETNGEDEIWRNYTSNVSPMWTKAIQRSMTLAEIIEAYPNANTLHPILIEAMQNMGHNWAEYEAMNPPNGWGDAEGAFDYLAWITKQCLRHPKATVRVSR